MQFLQYNLVKWIPSTHKSMAYKFNPTTSFWKIFTNRKVTKACYLTDAQQYPMLCVLNLHSSCTWLYYVHTILGTVPRFLCTLYCSNTHVWVGKCFYFVPLRIFEHVPFFLSTTIFTLFERTHRGSFDFSLFWYF